MTPLQRYQAYCDSGKINPSPAQQEIVNYLEELHHALLSKNDYLSLTKSTLFRSLGLRQVPIRGLYLWGDVGRGKTFLMDLFYQSLPFQEKTRLHFHRFMFYVHSALQKHQGRKDPLKEIAKEFAKTSMLLCFDEFYVKDIADAMILAELFENLFHQGVTLVATSNLPPKDLYENGLQRERFLPTIDLIEKYTRIMQIGGEVDYRLQNLSHNNIYHYPLDELAKKNLMQYFHQFAPEGGEANKVLTITEREIMTQYSADSVVWFSFENLCESARSTLDYIEIARCYKTVLMSGVKAMGEEREDVALRFIALVDEFYERHVTLILTAEVPLTSLYQGKRHGFEFQRTISRLTEMQTPAYLAKPHLH